MAIANASNMDTKIDVTVVNEYGHVLLNQMVFVWEPVMWVQNRVSTMLNYPVTLSTSVEDDAFLPLDTWETVGSRIVVAREYLSTTPVWQSILQLGKNRTTNPLFQNAEELCVSVFNSQTMTNVCTNLITPSENRRAISLEVEPIGGETYSDERGWSVVIPSTRYDIMDSITGDMSVTKSEKMYIEMYVSGMPDDCLLEMQQAYIRDLLLSSSITEYLYVFFIVKDINDDTVYFTSTW